MRSLVITTVIILFCLMSSVVNNLGMFKSNDVPTVGVNQSTLDEFTGRAGITTGNDGQNQFYTQGINIINLLSSIVGGIIFIGGTLHNMGMDNTLATGINAAFGLLVAFDLLVLWRGINW